MSAYFIHDGRNESGPYSVDELLDKKLTRNTPIRLKDSNYWMPAEKLPVLKEKVVPRKIRRPKDIVPGMVERVTDMYYRKPRALYSILLGAALFGTISIYSINKSEAKPVPAAAAITKTQPVAEVAKPEVVQNLQPELATVTAVKPVETKKQESPTVKPVKAPDKIDREKAARLKWSKLITVTNSNYGIGLLGGIKDLKVIVTNRSDYPLDEVVAKVTYLKANGNLWKTSLVTIGSVPADDTVEQEMEDVGRGKKVKVTIQKIVSKKMKFSYTEGQKTNSKDDPYFKE
jgi:hypothetical protein